MHMSTESREEAAMLWEDVVQLACEGGDPEMAQWLDRLLPIALDGATLTCATKLKWTERRVMTNYREAIERSIREITMEPIALSVVVDPAYFVDSPTPANTPAVPSATAPATQAAPVATLPAQAIPTPTTGSETPTLAQPVEAATASSTASTPGAPSAAALAGAQAATSRTTHPLIGLRTKIPASAQAALTGQALTPQASGTTVAETAPVADITLEGASVTIDNGTVTMGADDAATGAARSSMTSASTEATFATAPSADGSKAIPGDQDFGVQAPHVQEPTPVSIPQAIPALPTSANQSSEPDAPLATAPTHGAFPTAAPASPTAQPPTGPRATPQAALSEYTFDTFVVGEANRMAYDAARTIAEEEVVPYNPLFLYSKPGLGKTHLLLAIQNYIQMYRPGVRVLFATSAALLDAYSNDMKAGRRGSDVLRAYREPDVLLIDDVQFFEKKDATQITFFDIFNQLTLAGKRIVLTADEPPDYLKLDERLKQRFGMGLVVDIAMPSHELKQTILRSYSQTYASQMALLSGVRLAEDTLDYMAELSPNNIREMLGFLKRVMAEQAAVPSQPLMHERIKAVRDNLFKTGRRIEIDTIIDVVCEDFGVGSADVRGASRKKPVSEARQVTMWLARQMTDDSYQAIGTHFGRDHSTVYTSISKIDALSQADPAYLNRLEQLRKRVEGRSAAQ